MAYSVFEKPKLSTSAKFYPAEDIAHSYIPYRQRYSGFELDSADLFSMMATAKFSRGDQSSLCVKSSMDVKCPIYVHEFGKLFAVHQEEGDFGRKKKVKKNKLNKNQPASVLNKLEETYWAMWKPEKLQGEVPVRASRVKTVLPHSPPTSSNDTVDALKNSPQARKLKIFPERKHRKISSRSREIQTDESFLKPAVVVSEDKPAAKAEEEMQKTDSNESGAAKEKTKTFLKHTDSYILTTKKRDEDKGEREGERIVQPKCIKLFKKSSSSAAATGSFIKGGSYPLKSCLRKDSSFGRSNIRLGRPGSPMMLSTSSHNKSKGQKK